MASHHRSFCTTSFLSFAFIVASLALSSAAVEAKRSMGLPPASGRHHRRLMTSSRSSLLPGLTLPSTSAVFRRSLARPHLQPQSQRSKQPLASPASAVADDRSGRDLRATTAESIPTSTSTSTSASTSTSTSTSASTGTATPSVPSSPASLSSMTWQSCGGGPPGAPMLAPNSVTLAPDPPHHGRTLQVNVTGTCPISTDGGRLRVAVLYLGFRVYSYESALCDAMACPLVEGGAFELRVSQKLPVLAPPGSYSMEITGEDAGGARFMCVSISFSVAMPPGLSGSSDTEVAET